jgi:hypothetical protein
VEYGMLKHAEVISRRDVEEGVRLMEGMNQIEEQHMYI